MSLLLCSFVVLPFVAVADVSLSNGNFAAVYFAIRYVGSQDPTVQRAYAGKSTFTGIFGHRWGFEYEISRVVVGDRRIVPHEFGDGAKLAFSRVSLSASGLDCAIDVMTLARRRIRGPLGANSARNKRARLWRDGSLRDAEWTSNLARRLVPPRLVANGTRRYRDSSGPLAPMASSEISV